MRSLQSELTATPRTKSECPCNVWRSRKLPTSQSFTVQSELPDTRSRPFMARLVTPQVCDSKFASCFPVVISHTRMLLSRLPEYSRFPSEDTAQAITSLVCPLNWITGCWSSPKRHSLRLWSQLPDTKEPQPGVTAKQLTEWEWALTEASCWPDAMSHRSTEPLSSPDSSQSASTQTARQWQGWWVLGKYECGY